MSSVFPGIVATHDGAPVETRFESLQYRGTLDGLVCQLEVIQIFNHETDGSVVFQYIFPTTPELCIYDTTFHVGDRVIHADVKSKEEGKQTYDEAVSSGHTALYGSEIDKHTGQFLLGNVPPNVDVKVVLKVVISATLDSAGLTRLVIPTSAKQPTEFVFDLAVIDAEDVRSNEEGIFDGNSYKISNKTSTSFAITVRYKSNIENVGHCKGRYMRVSSAVTIPESYEPNADFVFIVDCSGSMSDIIKYVRTALIFLIRSLPPTSSFDIIKFGSYHEALFSKLEANSERTLKRALKFAHELKADMGGTNITPAVSAVYGYSTKKGRSLNVFIITDGAIHDRQQLLAILATKRNVARMFSLGISNSCDHRLVEGIATMTNGMADFITSDYNQITNKLTGMLQSAMSPAMTDLEFHSDGDITRMAPYPLPMMYSGLPLSISAECTDTITNGMLVGKIHDEIIEIPIEMRNFSGEEEALRALLAFELIEDLEQKLILAKTNHQDTAELVDAIVRLSCESGVLSSHTSFVGVLLNEPQHAPLNVDDNARLDTGRRIDEIQQQLNDMISQMNASIDSSLVRGESLSKLSEQSCSLEDNAQVFYRSSANTSSGCIGGGHSKPPRQPRPQPPPAPPLSEQILDLQSVDGSWQSVSALEKLVKLRMVEVTGIEDTAVLATLFAICIIHILFENELGNYAMILNKAKQWLAAKLPNVVIDDVVSDLASQLQSQK